MAPGFKFDFPGFTKWQGRCCNGLMVKKPYIVIPDPKGGWDIFREGSAKVMFHSEEKEVAVEKAREICTNEGTDLFIHSADGKYREVESYF
jgi:hypothetical protein